MIFSKILVINSLCGTHDWQVVAKIYKIKVILEEILDRLICQIRLDTGAR